MQTSILTTFRIMLVMGMVTLLSVSSTLAENVKGKIDIPLTLGFANFHELHIREPEMCQGQAGIEIKYNKNANKMTIKAKFDGLPYRPTFCYDYNPSTPYNAYPDCVVEGKWQIWLLARFLTKTNTFYYEANTHALIGNEFDVEPPADAIAREMPVLQMVCTPMFESNPANLKANVQFQFDYNQILDAAGTGGVYAGFVPYILDDYDTVIVYYTDDGLPVSEAMNFDDILDEAESGASPIIMSTSLEPDPKPAYLLARDNAMIGWGGGYPESELMELGLPYDLSEYGDCGSFHFPDPWPFLPDPAAAPAITAEGKLTTTWGSIKASR